MEPTLVPSLPGEATPPPLHVAPTPTRKKPGPEDRVKILASGSHMNRFGKISSRSEAHHWWVQVDMNGELNVHEDELEHADKE